MAYKSKYESMTKKDLRREVAQMVMRLNLNIYEYRQGEEVDIFENAISRLQNEGGKGRRGNVLSKGTQLNKADLIEYAESLARTEKWETFTPTGLKKQEDATRKAYKKFHKKHKGWSYKSFKNVGEIFGMLGDSLLDQLKSEQFVNNDSNIRDNLKKAINKGMSNESIADIVKNAYEKNKGGSVSTVLDAIEKDLAEALKNND